MCAAAGAQTTAPDNDRIFREIINSQSPYYYPALMLRYEAGDTTLTADDYRYLYYGYAYQPEYKPLEPVKGETQMLSVLEGIGEDKEPTAEEAERVIRYGKEIMQADPFSPRTLNFMTFAYTILGDTVNARIYADKRVKVLKAIEASGSGLREKSPWHILFFTHANDLLSSRGMDISKRMVRSNTVEYVHPVRRMEEAKGYYFDFGRIYWKKPENTDREKRVQGFEINGIKLRGKKGIYNPTK